MNLPRRRRLYLMRHGSVDYFRADGTPVLPETVPLNADGERQEQADPAIAANSIRLAVPPDDQGRDQPERRGEDERPQRPDPHQPEAECQSADANTGRDRIAPRRQRMAVGAPVLRRRQLLDQERGYRTDDEQDEGPRPSFRLVDRLIVHCRDHAFPPPPGTSEARRLRDCKLRVIRARHRQRRSAFLPANSCT